MYSHCIYCRRDLGANAALTHLPIGRRVAFDGVRGRLWVVCPSCERWNLAPLAERWEAVEECSRRFEESPLRISTEKIVVAALAEGTELIRIGRTAFPEYAAWRYGAALQRRRRRLIRTASVGAASLAAASLALAGPALAGLSLVAGAYLWWGIHSDKDRLVAVITLRESRPLQIRKRDLSQVWLIPRTATHPWKLQLPWETTLSGPAAVQALATLLPHLNAFGASSGVLQHALEELAQVTRSADYFDRIARQYPVLAQAPQPIRLALEMAANEQSEESLLTKDLATLTAQWREAEEVAAIADRLVIPERIEQALARLKRRRTKGASG